MRVDYAGFQNRVRATRVERGYSQRTLSEMIDKSDSFIQHLENGRIHPTLEVLVDLCYALSVTPNTLLADTFPEDRFGETPLLAAVRMSPATGTLRNTLTNWLDTTEPDESLPQDDPLDEPVDLHELPPLGFVALEDDMPDPLV